MPQTNRLSLGVLDMDVGVHVITRNLGVKCQVSYFNVTHLEYNVQCIFSAVQINELTKSCNDVAEVGLERGDVPSQAGFIPDGCLMSW